MISKNFIVILILALFAGTSTLRGQTPDAVKPSLVTGEVTSLAAGVITLNTKDGELKVTLSDKTEFKRVSAASPSLKTATVSTLADIGVGDKLAVTGIFGADKKVLPARSVYLMSKSDIAAKRQKESEEWKTRGITGRVVSVNVPTNQVSVEMRGLAGSTNIMLSPKEKVKVLRYAPNSIKFDEAVPSSIAEIKAGDMLRALGDRSADGTGFAAEEIVTGAFQTLGGTVKSVDIAKNEVVITNLQTKKDVTVSIGPSTLLKRFPEEMATRMAAFQSGAGGARPVGQGARPPQGENPGGATASGPGRGPGGGMRGGIDEMLERFPTITAADLKVGDMIAVSSTKNGAVDHITAIKLLAGVEPFIKAAQAAGGQPGSRANSGQGDFNIPGLDGFGTP